MGKNGEGGKQTERWVLLTALELRNMELCCSSVGTLWKLAEHTKPNVFMVKDDIRVKRIDLCPASVLATVIL